MTEQELLKQLQEVESLLKDSRLKVSDLKEKLTNAETLLIGQKLQKDRLMEKIRQVRNASHKPDPDHREADNARFLAALPELLKKV